ncbi:MAG: glycosyltransferase family 4 protein [Syntrophaceae bacterium]|nr:glycosyltransferase family 4 protein [Syntrophaceae bacterium]
MSEKYVIYAGNFDFSEKIAAGKRVLGISYAFRDLGYRIILVGCNSKSKNTKDIINTKQIVDGFESYMLPYPKSKKDWISFKEQYAKLINLLADLKIVENIQLVIIYGCPGISLWGYLLYRWCKKRDIKFLTDVVDWLPANRGSLLFRAAKWMDTAYLKRYLNAKADGVIAVSRYLSNFYNSKGCKVITIPPITDTSKYKFAPNSAKDPGLVKLIYVGTPFALDNKKISKGEYKDRLDVAIRLLVLVRKSHHNFTFNIYGITKEEYLNVLPGDKDALFDSSDYIIFHGKVSNDKAMQKIHESDFSMLLRDNNRTTMAGFPTKFSESISCGTPVITNKSSNLDYYLVEGINGYWLELDDFDKSIIKLQYILDYSNCNVDIMKHKCYESKVFDYRNYLELVSDLLIALHV